MNDATPHSPPMTRHSNMILVRWSFSLSHLAYCAMHAAVKDAADFALEALDDALEVGRVAISAAHDAIR